ncbi:MAG: hypothetical protein Q9P01_15155 [Anaerolineae bacterium]|nr:hypothetical protein [Anaerolineae bacterium]
MASIATNVVQEHQAKPLESKQHQNIKVSDWMKAYVRCSVPLFFLTLE